MSPGPHAELKSLYAEWRRLTHLEGDAIRDGCWTEVERQQFLKRSLRDSIVQAIQAWNAEHAGLDTARELFEREFRPVVTELIAEEHRNLGWLQEQRNDLQGRLDAVGRTSSRLRGVQRAYGGVGSDTRWQSYS